MMNKKEISKIMSKSPRHKVIELAKEIEKPHPVVMVKKPAKTLVMLKMRESVAKSEYFLGELLACEAMVKIGDKRGLALTADDDFDKVLAMAVGDAAYNAGVPETDWLNEKLAAMGADVSSAERKEFTRHVKSKVQFRVMEGQ
jgi:alpha-D-ribose 1-methylphosphonate 5-triphosphate synthase subunit PhnG